MRLFNSPKLKRTVFQDFLMIALIGISIFALLTVRFCWYDYQNQVDNIRLRLEAEAGRLDRSLTETIDYSDYILHHVSQQIHTHTHDLKFIHQVFNSFRTKSSKDQSITSTYTLFNWLNEKHEGLVSSYKGILPTPISLAYHDYPIFTKETPGTFFIGNPIIGAFSLRWIVPTAIGVTNTQGKFAGTLMMGIDLLQLSKKLEGALSSKAMSFILLDSNLNMVAESQLQHFSRPLDFLTLLKKETPHQPQGLLNKPMPFFSKDNVTFFQKNKYGYLLLVAYDKKLTDHHIAQSASAHLLEFFAIGLFMSLSLLMLKQRIISPILRLSQMADQISHGEVIQKMDEGQTYEIDNLSCQLKRVQEYTQQLRQTQHKLMEANELVKNTLGYMAHELKTPLNHILGFSELALAEKLALASSQREYIEQVYEAGKLQKRLIETFLKAARYENAEQSLEESSIDLAWLIQTRVGMVKKMAQEKQITIEINLLPDLPKVKGDEIKLGQAIMNLTSNGIKYNRSPGSLIISSQYNDQKDLQLHFKDTGIGIDETDLHTLFTRFGRIQSDETQNIEGTGLGLTFTKEIIELHEGTLTVTSIKGEGSCFTITLPRKRLRKAITSDDTAA